MDVAGCRSTDGIRKYKEVCLDQCKTLSDIIQNPRRKVKHDVEPHEAKLDSVSAMQGACTEDLQLQWEHAEPCYQLSG